MNICDLLSAPLKSESTAMPAPQIFILLKDFEHAYDNFALKVAGINEHLFSEIVQPMEVALRNSVDRLEVFSLQNLRDIAQRELSENLFKVTLDGGTYFSGADFSIEITRACLRLEQSATGPYFRMPRELSPQLVHQALRLKRAYEERGGGRPIALCDDGIGTGDSLGRIIGLLEQLSIPINRIVVFLNPRSISAIQNIDVETLLRFDDPHLWLSERDLYWGLPRSGLSFAPSDEMKTSSGIPYTLTDAMVQARIGMDKTVSVPFRLQCLMLNRRFWELLERHHNRALFLQDCARLEFLATVEPKSIRVVDFLAKLVESEINLVGTD